MYARQAAVLSACHPHRHLCDDGGLSSLPAITHCLTHGGKSVIYFCPRQTVEQDNPFPPKLIILMSHMTSDCPPQHPFDHD